MSIPKENKVRKLVLELERILKKHRKFHSKEIYSINDALKYGFGLEGEIGKFIEKNK